MTILRQASNRPGVDYIEVRDRQYFSRYKYRASMEIPKIRKRIVHHPKDSSILHEYYKWKSTNQKADIRYRIEGDTVSIFGNDLNLLLTLNEFYPKPGVVITEAVFTENGKEVKYFIREPRHQYRIYLNTIRIRDTDSYSPFIELTSEYQSGIYPSSETRRFIRGKSYSYLDNGYFDLDDELLVTMLVLKYDYLFKRVLKLEKLPEL